jgi:hypothetical protein
MPTRIFHDCSGFCFGICCAIGRVHYYDQLNQTLRFKEKDNGKIRYIHVSSVKEIKTAPSSP